MSVPYPTGDELDKLVAEGLSNARENEQDGLTAEEWAVDMLAYYDDVCEVPEAVLVESLKRVLAKEAN